MASAFHYGTVAAAAATDSSAAEEDPDLARFREELLRSKEHGAVPSPTRARPGARPGPLVSTALNHAVGPGHRARGAAQHRGINAGEDDSDAVPKRSSRGGGASAASARACASEAC